MLLAVPLLPAAAPFVFALLLVLLTSLMLLHPLVPPQHRSYPCGTVGVCTVEVCAVSVCSNKNTWGSEEEKDVWGNAWNEG